MKVVKNWLISHFGFSQSEMNGTIILLLLIILLAIVPRMYLQYQESQREIEEPDREKFLAWAEQIEKSVKPIDFSKSQNKQNYNNNNFTTYKKKQYQDSRSNYTQEKASSELASEAEEVAVITKKVVAKFDLNLATSDQLTSIKGIGPVLSERIVKFRDRLGGFQNTEQLNEVYGLQPEVAEALTNASFIEQQVTQTIPLNSDSLKLLLAHPYIDYQLAKQIINYRRVHGNYQDVSELQSLKLLSDSLYQKLYPYLSLKD